MHLWICFVLISLGRTKPSKHISLHCQHCQLYIVSLHFLNNFSFLVRNPTLDWTCSALPLPLLRLPADGVCLAWEPQQKNHHIGLASSNYWAGDNANKLACSFSLPFFSLVPLGSKLGRWLPLWQLINAATWQNNLRGSLVFKKKPSCHRRMSQLSYLVVFWSRNISLD